MASFQYDVFISYSSKDRPWAEKLFQGLTARGLNPFYDQARLEAGQNWDTQLMTSLRAARHLIVIWSSRAKASDWVQAEVNRFITLIDPDATGQYSPDRGVIEIDLEGENVALNKYQRITTLKSFFDAMDEDAGLGKMGTNTWSDLLDKLEKMVRNHDPSTPVPVAVLTTTQDRFQHQVNWGFKTPGGLSLDEIVAQLQLGTKNDILNTYGCGWRDWKPFHGNAPIWDLLQGAKDLINQITKGKPFRWQPLDDIFYDYDNADSYAIDKEIKLMESTLSILVVDPLSLYDPLVKWRFERMYSLFSNPNILIFVLPPIPIPSTTSAMRQIMNNVAKPVFDHFYNPPIHLANYAACAGLLNDEMDIRRWLLMMIGTQFRAESFSEDVTFLKYRSNKS